LNEEKSKHAGLAQEIGSAPACLQSLLLRLVKGAAKQCSVKLLGKSLTNL
jgi:hypothetical protein